ncbi:VOC family protein [Micromonospora sp. NPDC049679]|uniref:VOC family protein n=1 Tax=Micromonospora sp. NPDC049679 TaxID=3155920 RepID=UPI0033DBB71A
MAVKYKLAFDAEDPHRLAAFWAEALGYVVEDHSTMIRDLLDGGVVGDADVTTMDGRLRWRAASAIRDPAAPVDEYSGMGQEGRVLFQAVTEAKTAKNRVHLDLHVGEEQRAEVIERLSRLGARTLWDGRLGPRTWVTMADPEGNEFCVA